MKLSIVIPAYNEAESLPHLHTAIVDVMQKNNYTYEIIIIDDGSTDGTHDVVRKLHSDNPSTVKLIRFARNAGKSAALNAGFELASGNIFITMDADLQDDPVAIPSMITKLDEGFDLVSGWKQKRLDPVFTKNIPSKFFNFITSSVSGLKLHDYNCGFKAYKADAAKSIEIYGERHRYLPVLVHWNNYKVTEVPVPHHARKFGVTKFGLNRFINGPFDLITILFLQKYLKNPLHFFGVLGLVFILLGSGVLGYFGVEWIITRQMHIRPLTLLSLVSILMGIQFMSIGLLGEMITNTASKKNYTIRETLE